MGTDSRKDSDKDRHAAVENGGDTLRRMEVITGTGRRRRWSTETKARIVAESFEPGVSVSEVARRHDVRPGLLFLWRRQMTTKAVEARNDRHPPAFVPVTLGGGEPVRMARELPAIEIEVGGIRIRVTGRVDGSMLREVLAAARATR